jgi:hypothetical protein
VGVDLARTLLFLERLLFLCLWFDLASERMEMHAFLIIYLLSFMDHVMTGPLQFG